MTPSRPGGAVGDLIVAVPSISFPVVELLKMTGVQAYEERLLCFLLLLEDPALTMVFVTSEAVDPATVDYYLRFLGDPEDARRRLRLVTLDDPTVGSLSAKLLARPADFERLRAAIADVTGERTGGIVPFNVSPAEQDLADALGLPLFGPRPDLVWLGSKSGSRHMAVEAGVAVQPGASDVFSVAELAEAVVAIRERRPTAEAVVVKLNNGFSGKGSAIIELDGLANPLTASSTTFCALEESWPSFEPKIEAEGAIVEAMVRSDGLRSPSVQLQISPTGGVEVLSTHDQILGGPQNQVYLGCRFPARAEYRLAIQTRACAVAQVLAERGVTGAFGIDFLVDPDPVAGDRITLSEINLRMGGTTHPFWMARLASGGLYDQESGELCLPEGGSRCYLATDNLTYESLVGRSPAEIIERIGRAGLAYDPSTATGVTLHLLGALRRWGKMGVTCIASTPEEADVLYHDVLAVLADVEGDAP